MNMGRERQDKGAWGEAVACDYLSRRGFTIANRNWRAGHRELDIVARRGDTAHVVEVKTRRNGYFTDITDLIRPSQQRAILEAADAYARTNAWVKAIQIDLLIIIDAGNASSIELFPEAIQPNF